MLIDLLGALPGAVAQGLIWGVMAVGVYITYKILDIADLTVDGSICTGAAVCTMLLLSGVSLPLAMLAALRQTNDFVLSQGKPLDPMSKAAYDEIKAEVDARAAKAG